MAAFSVLPGCAHPLAKPAKSQPITPTTTAWFADLTDPNRDAVLRIRTSVLLKDSVYAPLVRLLFRTMTEQALHAGTDMTKALEGADEIIVTLREPSAGSSPEDPVLLLRGVPANLDPTAMTGLDGATQWRVSKLNVPNVSSFDFVPEAGELFVLLDRTWILTAGTGEQRVRTAFSHAEGRPVLPDLDGSQTENIPLSLEVAGASIVQLASRRIHVRALKPIFEELNALHVSVHIDKSKTVRDDLLVAEFDYAGVEQATRAEGMLSEVVGAFGRRGGKRWEWLKEADIARREQHVTVKAILPKWALLALANVDNSIF